MTDEQIPDERLWKKFSRENEFPISTVVSVFLHFAVLGCILFGAFSFIFDRSNAGVVEWESVTFADPPGAGNAGRDEPLGPAGPATPPGPDVTDAVIRVPPRARPADDITKPVVKVDDAVPMLPDSDPTMKPAVLIRPDTPLPKLASLLKGAPSLSPHKGTGGSGPGVGGNGKGTTGAGTGPDMGGRISQKTKRQLRWTLLFATSNMADYLRQLQALNAQLGIQMPDGKTLMIRDLAKRPAVVEATRPPAERIFWIDDNPESARALTDELQLTSVPWRMVAFFPESLEKHLVERELLYGKSFNRLTEEDIKETKFRVEFRSNQPKFIVVEQR